ncbi:MAG TPA: alanine racemase, partial [Saprospiraceae bacterium]|nr:alanine racemase [Saprospiraceae bacterium]
MIFDQITKPTLLLDQERCLRNIDRIIQKTRRQGITLRPHFKTHQSLEIGRWFRQRGVDRITVTSVDMANYFLRDQWDDITIAFPVNVRQVEDIKLLTTQCRLSLVVVNPESLEILGHELKSGVHIWIKVDVGTHRTGIGPSHDDEIESLMDVMDRFPLLHFSGFLGHAGHSYGSRTKAEVEASYRQSVDIMAGLKKKYLSRYPLLLTSLGDTPGVSMTDDLRGVDELRPGN